MEMTIIQITVSPNNDKDKIHVLKQARNYVGQVLIFFEKMILNKINFLNRFLAKEDTQEVV